MTSSPMLTTSMALRNPKQMSVARLGQLFVWTQANKQHEAPETTGRAVLHSASEPVVALGLTSPSTTALRRRGLRISGLSVVHLCSLNSRGRNQDTCTNAAGGADQGTTETREMTVDSRFIVLPRHHPSAQHNASQQIKRVDHKVDQPHKAGLLPETHKRRAGTNHQPAAVLVLSVPIHLRALASLSMALIRLETRSAITMYQVSTFRVVRQVLVLKVWPRWD